MVHACTERKEREAYEQRLTGRQIFQSKRMGGTVEDEVDEDEAAEVDYSQYDRENRSDNDEDANKDDGVLLADSDSDWYSYAFSRNAV